MFPLILDAEIYDAVWAVVINTDADIQEALIAVAGTKLILLAVLEYEVLKAVVE